MPNKLKIKGRVRVTMRNAKSGEIVFRSKWKDNIIPAVGIYAILNRLGNEAVAANEGIITYGAIGDGNTTPVDTDTIMHNELFRKAVATTTRDGKTLTIETFFTAGEANYSMTQFALFGEDASAAADSGTMFEYINFAGTFTKTTDETMTIETEISIA